MTLPVDYAAMIAAFYPELKLYYGTAHMYYLVDYGATAPKRFIFDESLMNNDKVRSLNIKTLLKLMESIFELDLYGKIDCRAPDLNKLSYLCLQAAEYMKSHEAQLKEQLLLNLDQVSPQIQPVASDDTQPAPPVPESAAAETNPQVQQYYFASEPKNDDYSAWEHKDLVNYVLMLEQSNAELTDKANGLQYRIDTLETQVRAFQELERRENFVPDVVRAGKDEKKRWFVF